MRPSLFLSLLALTTFWLLPGAPVTGDPPGPRRIEPPEVVATSPDVLRRVEVLEARAERLVVAVERFSDLDRTRVGRRSLKAMDGVRGELASLAARAPEAVAALRSVHRHHGALATRLAEPQPSVDPRLEGIQGIAGTVTEAATGSGVLSAQVNVYNTLGELIASASPNGSGDYAVAVDPGTYFVSVSPPTAFFGELWNNLPCPAGLRCDLTAGTPVPVTTGAFTSGIDFALEPAGMVTGTITDAGNGAPLSSAFVTAFDASGFAVGFASTNASGDYTVTGLAPGDHFVRVSSLGLYAGELYDDLPCPDGCDPLAGTPVAVAGGATTSGIDFGLVERDGITGRVTASGSGDAIAAIVDVYDSAGNYVSSGGTDVNGDYAVGLPAGTYVAVTFNFDDHVDELWNDRSCPNQLCVVTAGDPIVVSGVATGIDFVLDPAGSFEGTITDATAGALLNGISTRAFDATGSTIGFGFSGGGGTDGAYDIEGLPAGTTYATSLVRRLYGGELYDGLPCADDLCDPTAGTAISVTAGASVPGIDFALDEVAGIKGTVTETAGGTGLFSTRIQVFENPGFAFVGNAFADFPDGRYGIPLPPGSYFVFASRSDFADEYFDDVPCGLGCNVSDFTAVTVTADTVTSGIDFALDPEAVVVGRVTDGSTGDPIPGALVLVKDPVSGSGRGRQTDANGEFEIGDLPGTTVTATTNPIGLYRGEIYDELPCPFECDPASGTPIALTAGTTTSGVDFTLVSGEGITGTIGTASVGAFGFPVVIAHDSSGFVVRTTRVEAPGPFALGLEPGTYFLTILGLGSFRDELYDDLPCADGVCDPTDGTPIVVPVGGVATGIDIILEDLPVFQDGFESGNTSAWSAVVP